LLLSKAYILSFCLTFIIGSTGYCQSFTIYNTSNSPLENNTIRCFAKDSSGVIWVGTDFGLYSYDYTNWEVYTVANSSIESNQIRSLKVDSINNLWVGFFDAGLSKFDGLTWQDWNASNSSIPDENIKSITIDPKGFIWLGTGLGLVKKDTNDTWPLWNTLNSNMWSNNVTSVLHDDTSLYFGTLNGGLNLMNDTSIVIYNLYTSVFPDNTVLSIGKSTSSLWCATPSQGAVEYLGPDLFQVYNESNSLLPTNALTNVHIGANDVFFGSQSKGIIIYNNGDFNYYNTENSSMPVDHVSSVFDDAGTVWVGTVGGGLVKMEGFYSKINEYNGLQVLKVIDNVVYLLYDTKGAYNVYDIMGKLILCKSVNSSSINLSMLKPGIYIIRIIDVQKNITFSNKVVVD
jgi:ligand-binding sensor domain-containing protein